MIYTQIFLVNEMKEEFMSHDEVIKRLQWMRGLDERGFAEFINRHESKVVVSRTESQSKWISVDDRLPENDDEVLVYNPRDGINLGGFNPEREKKTYRSAWETYDEWAPNMNPTHWMPLPSMPIPLPSPPTN